jgi:hypothetical protein
MSVPLISRGLSQTLLNAVAAAPVISTEYAIPARAVQLSWQTIFGSAPSSIQVDIEGTTDNVNWSQIDSSTSTTGVIRTVNTSVIAIRANLVAVSGGSGITVIAVPKVFEIVATGGIPVFTTAPILGDGTTGNRVSLQVGAFNRTVVNGTGASTNITVTGIQTTDELTLATEFPIAGSNVKDVIERTSAASITAANTIQISVDTTNSKILVMWITRP